MLHLLLFGIITWCSELVFTQYVATQYPQYPAYPQYTAYSQPWSSVQRQKLPVTPWSIFPARAASLANNNKAAVAAAQKQKALIARANLARVQHQTKYKATQARKSTLKAQQKKQAATNDKTSSYKRWGPKYVIVENGAQPRFAKPKLDARRHVVQFNRLPADLHSVTPELNTIRYAYKKPNDDDVIVSDPIAIETHNSQPIIPTKKLHLQKEDIKILASSPLVSTRKKLETAHKLAMAYKKAQDAILKAGLVPDINLGDALPPAVDQTTGLRKPTDLTTPEHHVGKTPSKNHVQRMFFAATPTDVFDASNTARMDDTEYGTTEKQGHRNKTDKYATSDTYRNDDVDNTTRKFIDDEYRHKSPTRYQVVEDDTLFSSFLPTKHKPTPTDFMSRMLTLKNVAKSDGDKEDREERRKGRKNADADIELTASDFGFETPGIQSAGAVKTTSKNHASSNNNVTEKNDVTSKNDVTQKSTNNEPDSMSKEKPGTGSELTSSPYVKNYVMTDIKTAKGVTSPSNDITENEDAIGEEKRPTIESPTGGISVELIKEQALEQNDHRFHELIPKIEKPLVQQTTFEKKDNKNTPKSSTWRKKTKKTSAQKNAGYTQKNAQYGRFLTPTESVKSFQQPEQQLPSDQLAREVFEHENAGLETTTPPLLSLDDMTSVSTSSKSEMTSSKSASSKGKSTDQEEISSHTGVRNETASDKNLTLCLDCTKLKDAVGIEKHLCCSDVISSLTSSPNDPTKEQDAILSQAKKLIKYGALRDTSSPSNGSTINDVLSDIINQKEESEMNKVKEDAELCKFCEARVMDNVKSKISWFYKSLLEQGRNHVLELYSTGCKTAKDCTGAVGSIKLDGVELGGGVDGMNIVVLSYPGYEFLYSKTYNTGSDVTESDKMVFFLDKLTSPAIVLVATQGEATASLTVEAWTALSKLAGNTEFYVPPGGSFTFIGYKGENVLPWKQSNQKMSGEGASAIFSILGSSDEYITFGGAGKLISRMVQNIMKDEPDRSSLNTQLVTSIRPAMETTPLMYTKIRTRHKPTKPDTIEFSKEILNKLRTSDGSIALATQRSKHQRHHSKLGYSKHLKERNDAQFVADTLNSERRKPGRNADDTTIIFLHSTNAESGQKYTNEKINETKRDDRILTKSNTTRNTVIDSPKDQSDVTATQEENDLMAKAGLIMQPSLTSHPIEQPPPLAEEAPIIRPSAPAPLQVDAVTPYVEVTPSMVMPSSKTLSFVKPPTLQQRFAEKHSQKVTESLNPEKSGEISENFSPTIFVKRKPKKPAKASALVPTTTNQNADQKFTANKNRDQKITVNKKIKQQRKSGKNKSPLPAEYRSRPEMSYGIDREPTTARFSSTQEPTNKDAYVTSRASKHEGSNREYTDVKSFAEIGKSIRPSIRSPTAIRQQQTTVADVMLNHAESILDSIDKNNSTLIGDVLNDAENTTDRAFEEGLNADDSAAATGLETGKESIVNYHKPQKAGEGTHHNVESSIRGSDLTGSSSPVTVRPIESVQSLKEKSSSTSGVADLGSEVSSGLASTKVGIEEKLYVSPSGQITPSTNLRQKESSKVVPITTNLNHNFEITNTVAALAKVPDDVTITSPLQDPAAVTLVNVPSLSVASFKYHPEQAALEQPDIRGGRRLYWNGTSSGASRRHNKRRKGRKNHRIAAQQLHHHRHHVGEQEAAIGRIQSPETYVNGASQPLGNMARTPTVTIQPDLPQGGMEETIAFDDAFPKYKELSDREKLAKGRSATNSASLPPEIKAQVKEMLRAELNNTLKDFMLVPNKLPQASSSKLENLQLHGEGVKNMEHAVNNENAHGFKNKDEENNIANIVAKVETSGNINKQNEDVTDTPTERITYDARPYLHQRKKFAENAEHFLKHAPLNASIEKEIAQELEDLPGKVLNTLEKLNQQNNNGDKSNNGDKIENAPSLEAGMENWKMHQNEGVKSVDVNHNNGQLYHGKHDEGLTGDGGLTGDEGLTGSHASEAKSDNHQNFIDLNELESVKQQKVPNYNAGKTKGADSNTQDSSDLPGEHKLKSGENQQPEVTEGNSDVQQHFSENKMENGNLEVAKVLHKENLSLKEILNADIAHIQALDKPILPPNHELRAEHIRTDTSKDKLIHILTTTPKMVENNEKEASKMIDNNGEGGVSQKLRSQKNQTSTDGLHLLGKVNEMKTNEGEQGENPESPIQEEFKQNVDDTTQKKHKGKFYQDKISDIIKEIKHQHYLNTSNLPEAAPKDSKEASHLERPAEEVHAKLHTDAGTTQEKNAGMTTEQDLHAEELLRNTFKSQEDPVIVNNKKNENQEDNIHKIHKNYEEETKEIKHHERLSNSAELYVDDSHNKEKPDIFISEENSQANSKDNANEDSRSKNKLKESNAKFESSNSRDDSKDESKNDSTADMRPESDAQSKSSKYSDHNLLKAGIKALATLTADDIQKSLKTGYRVKDDSKVDERKVDLKAGEKGDSDLEDKKKASSNDKGTDKFRTDKDENESSSKQHLQDDALPGEGRLGSSSPLNNINKETGLTDQAINAGNSQAKEAGKSDQTDVLTDNSEMLETNVGNKNNDDKDLPDVDTPAKFSDYDASSDDVVLKESRTHNTNGKMCKRHKVTKSGKKWKKTCIDKLGVKSKELVENSNKLDDVIMSPGYSTVTGVESNVNTPPDEVSFYDNNLQKNNGMKEGVFSEGNQVYEQSDYIHAAENVLESDVRDAMRAADSVFVKKKQKISAKPTVKKKKPTKKKQKKPSAKNKIVSTKSARRPKINSTYNAIDASLKETEFQW